MYHRKSPAVAVDTKLRGKKVTCIISSDREQPTQVGTASDKTLDCDLQMRL